MQCLWFFWASCEILHFLEQQCYWRPRCNHLQVFLHLYKIWELLKVIYLVMASLHYNRQWEWQNFILCQETRNIVIARKKKRYLYFSSFLWVSVCRNILREFIYSIITSYDRLQNILQTRTSWRDGILKELPLKWKGVCVCVCISSFKASKSWTYDAVHLGWKNVFHTKQFIMRHFISRLSVPVVPTKIPLTKILQIIFSLSPLKTSSNKRKWIEKWRKNNRWNYQKLRKCNLRN